MSRIKLSKALPLVLAMTALAVFASSGGASTTPFPLIDTACLSAPADATLLLGAGVPAVAASSDFNYGSSSRPCTKFIVDVSVPWSSSAPGFQRAFSLTASSGPDFPTRSSTCQFNYEGTTVYRKNPGQSGFTLLGDEVLQGVQVDGDCVMVPTSGDPWPLALNPPLARTATYRIVTRAIGWWDGGDLTDSHFYLAHRVVRAAHLPAL